MSKSGDAGKWLVIFVASGQTTQMLLSHCSFSIVLLHLVHILGPGHEGEATVTENSIVFRVKQQFNRQECG